MSILCFIITLLFYIISITFFSYFKFSIIIASIPIMLIITKNKLIPIILYILLGILYDAMNKTLPFLIIALLIVIILISIIIFKRKNLSTLELIIYSIFITFTYNFIIFIAAKISLNFTYNVYNFIESILPITIYTSIFILIICIIFRKNISRKKDYKININ